MSRIITSIDFSDRDVEAVAPTCKLCGAIMALDTGNHPHEIEDQRTDSRTLYTLRLRFECWDCQAPVLNEWGQPESNGAIVVCERDDDGTFGRAR